MPDRVSAQPEAPSPAGRGTDFGPTQAEALRSNRSTNGLAAGTRRSSCLGLARGCQPPGWPIPGPTSENQASIRLRSSGSGPVPSGTNRFSIAGTDHLSGVSGYCRRLSRRGVGPLTNVLSGERLGDLRAASGSPSGEFQVRLPGNGRLDRFTDRGRSSSEERASSTGESQSEVWNRNGFGRAASVPGQRTSLERPRNSASRRSVELAQLGLATFGCDSNWPRLVEVQVPPGALRALVSSEPEYEGLLREVGAI